ncbi:sensor histidine kinase [Pseudorhizobium pelagicum]|uniref:sensor histidine kinase n=1 Tax=Pseudorhizobium pelagicum TaxID=1509405 RepID=UPI000689374A|nr:ATP-binding protein [Pseudorhizobium pelagicum]
MSQDTLNVEANSLELGADATTAILAELITQNRKLSRYQSIFDHINLGFFEQDLSDLRAYLARLRDDGVVDIRAYASDKPSFPDDCLNMIRTVDVNDACVRLMGANSKDDLIGPTRFRPPHSYRLGAIAALFEGQQMITGKTTLEGVDGRELVVLFTAILDWEDRVDRDRLIFSITDITEQERTNERLLRTQEALAKANRVATIGALSASIAHELNQPLGALLMDAQTTQRWLGVEQPNIAKASEALDRVVSNARRAADIVRSVRDRVVNNRARTSSVDPVRLVKETATLLERELARYNARIKVEAPDIAPPLDADPGELQQVILNLIVNGLQSMAAGGRSVVPVIDVQITQWNEDMARISVRDRGPGIAKDQAASLFDPFYTTKPDGMGMGLAICRSTIESYGGEIEAFNHPDGGAIFQVTVPIFDRTNDTLNSH